jgi:hypothetical protein
MYHGVGRRGAKTKLHLNGERGRVTTRGTYSSDKPLPLTYNMVYYNNDSLTPAGLGRVQDGPRSGLTEGGIPATSWGTMKALLITTRFSTTKLINKLIHSGLVQGRILVMLREAIVRLHVTVTW